MNDDDEPEDGIVVHAGFVRGRNALLTRASFAPLFRDYYLHLAACQRRLDARHDGLFRDALVAFVLHAAGRPRTEMLAWTLGLQDPRLNLFVTGDNETGDTVGRVFTENVREAPRNLLFVETVRARTPRRRSVVDFTGTDLFRASETFYQQSEQRPARLFDLGDETFALLAAHPDCDLEWLESRQRDDIARLSEVETLATIETRRCRWRCGCTQRRMLEVLAPSMRQDPQELFQGDEVLRIDCPRCALPYHVTREALEAFVATQPD